MHTTEFYLKDGKWYFVADYLYILRLAEGGYPCQLDILTKEEVDRYADSNIVVTRIRTTKLDRDLFKREVGLSLTPEKAWLNDRSKKSLN